MVPKNPRLVSKVRFWKNGQLVQKVNELSFSGDAECEPFTVKLNGTISRDPAMVGRSTVVLNATSDEWPDNPLVVKISWPTSGRVSETDFLEKVNGMAEGDHAWATNHLPQVHYAEDVIFPSDSTLESVARLFENGEFTNGDFVYERRTLQIIIQERLYPLKLLANMKDIGQVLLDVACSKCIPSAFQLPLTYPVLVHRWLYDHPGILHCDLSFNNIMYHLLKEMNTNREKVYKVYGVLTNYDLSLWTDSLNPNYTKTSQQWTGTPLSGQSRLLHTMTKESTRPGR